MDYARSGANPHVSIRLLGAALQGRHVAEIDGPSAVQADDQLMELFRTGQEGACLHEDLLVVRGHHEIVFDDIARLQGTAQVAQVDLVAGKRLRVQQHTHDL